MKIKGYHTVKLGVFVLAGLLFLILTLYMIGKNRNIFGRQYLLKTHFENVNGLVKGNNVRYAGIEVGTVSDIRILNDSAVEVTMSIQKAMKQVIRENALCSIGSDGLIGNRVVNIVPGHGQATLAAEKSLLSSRQPLEMDEMLRILGESGSNILRISEGMKLAVERLNSSKAFWKLLDNPSLGQNIEQSAANIQMASKEAVTITQQIDSLLRGVQQGKGNLGKLFKDSTIALQLEASASRISLLAGHTDSLAENLNGLVNMIKEEASTGNGTVHALLKDSILVQRIHKSLEEIEKGGRAFRQDMEALQHNFLLRPYFRKKEKEAARQKKKSAE